MLYETFMNQVSTSGYRLICCMESIQTPKSGSLITGGMADILIIGTITVVHVLAPTEIVVGDNRGGGTILNFFIEEESEAPLEATAAKHS